MKNIIIKNVGKINLYLTDTSLDLANVSPVLYVNIILSELPSPWLSLFITCPFVNTVLSEHPSHRLN